MDENTLEDIRRILEQSIFPFELVGAVIFGSNVKGTCGVHSDLDILMIADKVNPKRHRRGETITQIRQCLPGLPIDILLLTPQEVESNFRNHNPLFLDIAEEGIILVDRNRRIENMMEQTRQYIKKRGIKKLDEGWVFPVVRGTVTYLSQVSTRDFSLAMIKDGKRDCAIGRKLLETDFHDKAVYHFQQAVEKSIKGILIAMGIFRKTHFVGVVLRARAKEMEISDEWDKRLLEAAAISESIEPEVSLSRYPGIIEDRLWLPFEEYEKEDAAKAAEKATKVLSIAEGFVNYWFAAK
jgi:HEPN domain-containing protein/predicted nucleotidyltransferase